MYKSIYLLVIPVMALVVGCPTTVPVGDTGNENDSSMTDTTDGSDTSNDNGSSMTDMPDGSETVDAAAGATIFATSCAVCHADDATGNIGPNIQTADIPLITDHVIDAHEGHTTFELSAQDIADIQAYLASL